MPLDSVQAFDPIHRAAGQLAIEPVPSWTVPIDFDAQGKAVSGEPVSHLLSVRQVNAESRETYLRSAVRLETMQAVQHLSQWRVPFDPRTEQLTVHWIRIHRGDRQTDHANINRFRILQREEGLEGFVVDGHLTALLLLEDVRMGDILDVSYTVRSSPLLMPEHAHAFFSLPRDVSVHRYCFSFQCDGSRPVKWKTSSPNLSPAEDSRNGAVRWVWSGENHAGVKPEADAPGGILGNLWMQFSDCASWQAVSRGVAAAWQEQTADRTIGDLARQIEEKNSDCLARVEQAIHLVQDEHRYLSVNWDLGGHIPTDPATVARRRFGDCKDLSFLLVHLLKALGVPARPVLVNTFLRRTLKDMLPTPFLFNHVVVEYEVDGAKRWVDPTMNRQGGGALNRAIPDFGVGLVIDERAESLDVPPDVATLSGVYEVKETLLLDTTGKASILAVMVRATGSHADLLRRQFETTKREEIEAERLRVCRNRFGSANRAGPFEFRDERTANEFLIGEVFEVNGFLSAGGEPGLCQFQLPANIALHLLAKPESDTRQSPFALPYPCHAVHSIEVESSALQPLPFRGCNLECSFLQFRRTHKHVYRHWGTTFSLSTLVDSVIPERFSEYREMLDAIWQNSVITLTLPVGYAHPRRRDDFGRLPLARLVPPGREPKSERAGHPEESNAAREVTPSENAVTPVVPIQTQDDGIQPRPASSREEVKSPDASRQHSKQRKRHHHRRAERISWWIWLAGGVIVVLLIFTVLAIRREL